VRARPVGLLVVLAAAILFLAGCGGLPGTGPVVEGRALGDVVAEPVRVAAQGPVDGASQQAIIRGFMRAGEDNDETHQTGKLYLAPQSVDLWRWGSRDVVVYDGELSFRQVDADTVEVSARQVGVLSPDGHYSEPPPGTRATLTLGLTKVGGEWRIQLPQQGFGLWLDADQFERAYTNRLVYFVTPTGRDLVPDSRWFPNGSRLATTLARAQLSRVPTYLAGAVVTGVPTGTRLVVNAVPVENGVARVNLSGEALSADPDGRTAMWAQLSETLTQIPGVSAVALSVDNTPLELPGRISSVGSAAELGYEIPVRLSVDTALRREGDAISRFDTRFVPDTSSGASKPDLKPRDGDVTRIPDNWAYLAQSVDGKQVAAVAADRAQLSIWRGTGPTHEVDSFATSLTRPAYDAAGYVWLGGEDGKGTEHVYAFDSVSKDPKAMPRAVSTPWLKGRRVAAIAVAADSARVLLITTNLVGGEQQLGLSGIVRSSNGEPVALTPPQNQAQSLTRLQDATWLGAETYAVLGTVRDGQPMQPWTGTIGAGIDGHRHGGTWLDAAPGAVTITSAGGPRGLILVTSDDRILTRTGSTWRQIERGNAVLVPGS
jgi:hypothetical protein